MGSCFRDRKKGGDGTDAQCLRPVSPADRPPSLAWGQVSSGSRWLRPASLWPRGIPSENARWTELPAVGTASPRPPSSSPPLPQTR